ncbi:hypothetical protein [Pseudohalocynthiibacter sp. F2068]|uniref:hypothetical protein n=1 Tax=Pseudohalocynthiibacter sp. F2068 TaxID=2926418 RepID=UPI001FF28CB9|nr:hypothetical protein [Pseudohalocynthiibacter sp. F2068]MCK0103244.1 hypothetical protein [Pseudohalocynthiibacter sp. F2068]
MQISNLGSAAVFSLAFALTSQSALAETMINPSQDTLGEAVQLGTDNFDQHPVAFQWDYLTNLGLGYPEVLLRTRYLAVADYVRRSEFQRKFGTQRVHEITDERIKAAHDEVVGGLQFIVTASGPTEDFMLAYEFSMSVGDAVLEPILVDAPQKASPSGFMGDIAYTAGAIVDFDASGLSGTESVTLLVKAPDGRGPSGARNSAYEIPYDLSILK